jgi:hypothetical protein
VKPLALVLPFWAVWALASGESTSAMEDMGGADEDFSKCSADS